MTRDFDELKDAVETLSMYLFDEAARDQVAAEASPEELGYLCNELYAILMSSDAVDWVMALWPDPTGV